MQTTLPFHRLQIHSNAFEQKSSKKLKCEKYLYFLRTFVNVNTIVCQCQRNGVIIPQFVRKIIFNNFNDFYTLYLFVKIYDLLIHKSNLKN